MANKRKAKDARMVAANLPAPKPGMSFTVDGLDTLCEYMQMHGLRVVGFRGNVLVVDWPTASFDPSSNSSIHKKVG